MEFGQFKKREDGGGFRENRDNRDFKNRDNRSGGFQPRERTGGDKEDRERDESVFSKKVRAGKRRTYFFDVRKTKGEDFFVTITESTRREDGFGYKRHKLFLYKEDFNRFVTSLTEVIDHVKTELMPNFDYEEFDRRQAEWEAQNKEELDAEVDNPTTPEKEEKHDDDEMTW